MVNHLDSNVARDAIFRSIRSNLLASKPLDALEDSLRPTQVSTPSSSALPNLDGSSVIELFKDSLEAVDGHCLIVQSESELVQALSDIIKRVRKTNVPSLRIALSDSVDIERLVKLTGIEFDEVAVTPSASEMFGFDVGISGVQAAIAETGTLLLDSSRERHRLVSLVPPIHIAIVNARQIVVTLGEALALLRRDEQVSPIVTLVTGPSRTADIELTLAIGVHGPQELYVIVCERN